MLRRTLDTGERDRACCDEDRLPRGGRASRALPWGPTASPTQMLLLLLRSISAPLLLWAQLEFPRKTS